MLGPGYEALRAGRHSVPGSSYLVTTRTEGRARHFEDWRLGSAAASAIHRSPGDAILICWVLMPDHLHVLLQLGVEELPGIVGRIKGRSAAAVNRVLNRTGSIWQPGFHERAIRRSANLVASARYILANPVRAGLVRRVDQYPYWNANWVDGELVF